MGPHGDPSGSHGAPRGLNSRPTAPHGTPRYPLGTMVRNSSWVLCAYLLRGTNRTLTICGVLWRIRRIIETVSGAPPTPKYHTYYPGDWGTNVTHRADQLAPGPLTKLHPPWCQNLFTPMRLIRSLAVGLRVASQGAPCYRSCRKIEIKKNNKKIVVPSGLQGQSE